MPYFVDIFSVATYEEYSKGTLTHAGFTSSRKATIAKIKPGDKLVCYLKGFSAWIGLLEVCGELKDYSKESADDEFPLKFPVKKLVWLPKGALLPIKNPSVWSMLSITKDVARGEGGWNATLRSSGTRIAPEDGEALEQLLIEQAKLLAPDGFDSKDWKKERERSFKIKSVSGRTVTVELPEQDPEPVQPLSFAPETAADTTQEVRPSHKMQALLADIGIKLGLQVWIPRNDRAAVLAEMESGDGPQVLQKLPGSQFTGRVLGTVEEIDVLWIEKQAIVRAFEVEHTTAVYSGILRMADLLAMQPNFRTHLHIVAPAERRKKVLQELRRPAFSIFPQGPLSSLCSYIPYEKAEELSQLPHLSYLKQDVIGEFAEFAGEGE